MNDDGRRAYAVLVFACLLLTVPTLHAWSSPAFRIGAVEFDPWLGLVSPPTIARIVHSILFVCAGVAYWRLTLSSRSPDLTRTGMVVVLVSFAVPWISPDVMYYVAKGWASHAYHMPAYDTSIGEIDRFGDDPIFGAMVPGLANLKGNYGPLFQVLSERIAALANGSPRWGLVLFKLVMTVSLVGCCLQTRQLQMQTSDGATVWSLPLMLLNPLLLFNFVVAAHNDVLVMLLVLAGVQLALKQSPFWSGLAIGVSIIIKLVGVFLLPAIALYFVLVRPRRERGGSLLFGGLGLVAGLVVGIAPDLGSADYFGSVIRYDVQLFRSTAYVILAPLWAGWGFAASPMVVGKVLFVLAAAVVLLTNFRRQRERPDRFLIRTSFELLVLVQCLVLPSMNEWYVAWPMFFAFALPGVAAASWIRWITLAYMPLVVWAVVGEPAVTVTAQLVIMGCVLAGALAYFIEVARADSKRAAVP